MSILEEIKAKVVKRLAEDKKKRPFEALQEKLSTAHCPGSFIKPFQNSTINVISEIKFASPSEGDLSTNIDPVFVAGEYLKARATALSILTERDYFKGHIDYLIRVRKAFSNALILRKDFIFDEYQVLEARVSGADACLLIVALLADDTKKFIEIVESYGLTPLVEVHNKEELDIALRGGARLIGINNRNLKTMKIDLNTTFELITHIPNHLTVISESGIQNRKQIDQFKKAGVSGFLVGTQLMKDQGPYLGLKNLLDHGDTK